MNELIWLGAILTAACIGAGMGVGVMAAALYPQLVLLRSMLIDKHAKEVLKVRKPSQVQGLEPQVPEMRPDAKIEIAPPSLADRRNAADEAELLAIRRRDRMIAIAKEM